MKDKKAQSQKFIDKAKEIGADDAEAFERAFKNIVPPKTKDANKTPVKQSKSD